MFTGSPTARQLAIAGLCVLSLVVCCGLAFWQWERFSSASGTFQNLGYVLQWPLFGLFPLFMVWRFRRLRRAHAGAEPNARTTSEPQTAPRPTQAPPHTAEPQPEPWPAMSRRAVSQDDEDHELAAYNRYLAELHARDQRGN